MIRHVLPNCLAPIIVQTTLSLGWAIVNAAGLSFLGLGAQPPSPEWGAMLSSGREYMRNAPWITTFPGLAILLTALGFNLLGDGLRDALDPRLKE
jgi:peptide/nickel transport system permease protein